MIVFCSTQRIGPYTFYIEKFITQFKQEEKIIGHSTHFQENDYLDLSYEIMRSRDAQCNTCE